MLVAVSGGCDSMCLLYGLLALGYCRLVVCHLNHQLRGRASLADERFVARQAQKLGLPIALARAQTRQFASDRRISLETAGRELRHAFFAETAKRIRCFTLLLAHHADDQLETCWLNFLRGTGIAGLAGMRQESVRRVGRGSLQILRPLLQISRSKIAQFVCERKILFREDATNIDTRWTRNRIRHELLPFLDQKFGTTYRKAVLRCAAILAEEEDWIRESADQFSCGPQLSYKELLNLPIALQRRVLRQWLVRQGVPEVGFVEVERVRSLFAKSALRPAKVNLPAGIHARRRAGILFLEKTFPPPLPGTLHTQENTIPFYIYSRNPIK